MRIWCYVKITPLIKLIILFVLNETVFFLRIHKWRLSNYSFVFMIIILTSLVTTNKIQKNICSKVRLVRISAQGQKNNFLVAIYEYGLYLCEWHFIEIVRIIYGPITPGIQRFKVKGWAYGFKSRSRVTFSSLYIWMKGVVSKETVVLRRWGSSIQKFGFINGVDNVNWPPYRDSKSWRFER